MGVHVGVWMKRVGRWVGGVWANVYVKCHENQGTSYTSMCTQLRDLRPVFVCIWVGG